MHSLTSQLGRFVWIDLEMTGLDLKKDFIIEIACIITDDKLNVVAEADQVIINQPKSVMAQMNPWCIHHHKKSGLTDAVLKSTTTMDQAQSTILNFIQKYIPKEKEGILCGNSVHVDRSFLIKDMPLITDHLHYRIIDVSTIKELSSSWYPNLHSKAPPKSYSHRALDDIRDSINELKWYRQHLFVPNDDRVQA